jgi:hypothetical protein
MNAALAILLINSCFSRRPIAATPVRTAATHRQIKTKQVPFKHLVWYPMIVGESPFHPLPASVTWVCNGATRRSAPGLSAKSGARTYARRLAAINAEGSTIRRSAGQVITGNSLPERATRSGPASLRNAPKVPRKYDTFMTLALFVALPFPATH